MEANINPYIFAGLTKSAQHEFKYSKIAELLYNIEKSIKQHGGYYQWRDEAILENVFSVSKDAKLARARLNLPHSVTNKYRGKDFKNTKKRSRPWTKKEDLYLINNYSLGALAVSLYLKRTRFACVWRYGKLKNK